MKIFTGTMGKAAWRLVDAGGAGRIFRVLYFPTAEIIPVPSGDRVLDETGELLRAEPDWSVTLRGYTAPHSAPEVQRAIAELRARFCAHYLMKECGIAEERMRLEWYDADWLPEVWDGSDERRDCVEVIIEGRTTERAAGGRGRGGADL